jgi:hypothetical protein
MTDTIWFELADCIGHALAKRWLDRRRGPKELPATESRIVTKPAPECEGPDEKAAGGPSTDSIRSE